MVSPYFFFQSCDSVEEVTDVVLIWLDYPTADYIARHAEVYSNPNLTTWAAAGESFLPLD